MLSYTEFEPTLTAILKTLTTPCLVGPHGIGKTSFIKDYAERHGYHFVSFRLGQCSDVSDVLGRMVERNGRTAYLPHEKFPTNTDKPVLLFLDEINRASKDLLQYVFEVIEPTEPKVLGSYRFPPGSRVVAAMNPDTADYIVNGFDDAAFWSRLLKLEVMPTNDEFLKYVQDGPVKDFFHSHRELIKDRRAISQFALLHAAGLGPGGADVAKGMLGAETAGVWLAWANSLQKVTYSLEQVLTGKLPAGMGVSEKGQVCALLRDAVVGGRSTWNKTECEHLKQFFLSLDKEMMLVLAKDLRSGSPLFTSYLHNDKQLTEAFGKALFE